MAYFGKTNGDFRSDICGTLDLEDETSTLKKKFEMKFKV